MQKTIMKIAVLLVMGLVTLTVDFMANPGIARAEKVLRVGITASEIPLTTGQPSQGQAGMSWVGYNLYDSLIEWDLSRSDRPATLRPGLATSWNINKDNMTKWTFHLRHGVKFHDGSEFTADAVVWNFDKLLNPKAPQYDPRQASQGRSRITSVKSYRKIDRYTVEITTRSPDVFLPYQVAWILMSSPTQWTKVGRNWDEFAKHPSGTGPFYQANLIPRQQLVMKANKDYWDKNRVPQIDKLILVPLPEATTRSAALLSGQVDWIVDPDPDTVPALKTAGFKIVKNLYPQVWIVIFNTLEGSAFSDIRVRRAANLALNRDGLVKLLRGFAEPAVGLLSKSSPWFGHPKFKIHYDPVTAKALMKEAGYGPDHPLGATILTSSSGSGQMLPLPMMQLLQQNLAQIGIRVKIEVVDWNTLLSRWRMGAKATANTKIDGIQLNFNTQDPYNAIIRFMDNRLVPPIGVNYSYFSDAHVNKLIREVTQTADKTRQDEILGELHATMVDDALYLFAVHNVARQALSPRVKNFVPAQSWYEDLTHVTIEGP